MAVEDGDRESTESGLPVLRALHGRGFEAPRLAIGDGALGFWKALSEVWPQTAEQRGWVHRTANVLDKLPKRIQPRAKKHHHKIFQAETPQAAEKEVQSFVKEYSDRSPKAVASLVKDEEKLLTFYNFPAAHGMTIRCTNVIESAFATVWLRQPVTQGAGTRTRGLTMAHQLLAMAQKRWKAIRSPPLVQKLLDGSPVEDGEKGECAA